MKINSSFSWIVCLLKSRTEKKISEIFSLIHFRRESEDARALSNIRVANGIVPVLVRFDWCPDRRIARIGGNKRALIVLPATLHNC